MQSWPSWPGHSLQMSPISSYFTFIILMIAEQQYDLEHEIRIDRRNK